MPKTRLNSRDRDALEEYANSLIVCKREEAAEAKALDALRNAVGAALDRHYPMRDMRTLARYDVVDTPETVELWNATRDGSEPRTIEFVDRAWWLAKEDSFERAAARDSDMVFPVPTGRILPQLRHAGCGIPRVEVQDAELRTAMVDAYFAWAKAFNARCEAVNAKRKDYRTLIRTCSNWEDLIEVWPEAAALQNKRHPTTVIAVYDPNLVKRIKADVAARASA